MLEQSERPQRPDSPCVGVCVLEPSGLCRGCLRSGDEIAAWGSMSALEQWLLLEQLAERRRQRGST
jgi:uncharacterized protein